MVDFFDTYERDCCSPVLDKSTVGTNFWLDSLFLGIFVLNVLYTDTDFQCFLLGSTFYCMVDVMYVFYPSSILTKSSSDVENEE